MYVCFSLVISSTSSVRVHVQLNTMIYDWNLFPFSRAKIVVALDLEPRMISHREHHFLLSEYSSSCVCGSAQMNWMRLNWIKLINTFNLASSVVWERLDVLLSRRFSSSSFHSFMSLNFVYIFLFDDDVCSLARLFTSLKWFDVVAVLCSVNFFSSACDFVHAKETKKFDSFHEIAFRFSEKKKCDACRMRQMKSSLLPTTFGKCVKRNSKKPLIAIRCRTSFGWPFRNACGRKRSDAEKQTFNLNLISHLDRINWKWLTFCRMINEPTKDWMVLKFNFNSI